MPYFHVVFTVPAEVAAIAFHNKAVVCAILFDAARRNAQDGAVKANALPFPNLVISIRLR